MQDEPTESGTQSAPTGRQLTVIGTGGAIAIASATFVVPALIADAGEHATRRFLEFFAATIRNRNTRTAYLGSE